MSTHLAVVAAAALLSILVFAQSASEAPELRTAFGVAPPPLGGAGAAPERGGERLIEGESVEAPYAYRRLCAEAPHVCAAAEGAEGAAPAVSAMTDLFGRDALARAPIELTTLRRRQLDQVNQTVNSLIEPQADLGGDVWRLGALAGDCEEYVLAKRELLLRLGWPRTALRITVVHDGVGYHAVLVVQTDQGAFILDNMVGYVSRLEDSPYEFVVAESLERPGVWVRVARARQDLF